MAVMTSSLADKNPADLKLASLAPADAMAADTDANTNGVHDVRLDIHDSTQAKSAFHRDLAFDTTSAPAAECSNIISSDMDDVAQLLPGSQSESNPLLGCLDPAGTVTLAVEAPPSGVRDQPATAERIQHASDTQLTCNGNSPSDPMDVSGHAGHVSLPRDSAAPPTKPMNHLSIQTQSNPIAPQSNLTSSPTAMDREMEDAPSTGKGRPREEDDDEVPDAKRTKTIEEPVDPSHFKVPDVPAYPDQSNGTSEEAAAAFHATPEASGVYKAVDYDEWPTSPMTDSQNKFLLERIRNTKKIKVSLAFKDPVNPAMLGIPTYPDIVKNPMDLTTMENKLKEKSYTHIKEFMADLDQMIENSELFNNKQHPVTQAGYNLRAYFLKGVGKMPRGGAQAPSKQAKPKKLAVNTAPKARRESRTILPPTVKSPVTSTPTTATPSTAAWPLQQDGTPLIRRESMTADGRPKREIHRPTKDLPYTNAKPRRKKYQLELKFCESVLAEVMKPKYSSYTFPFISPVDPVALNIPSYLKIIKKPMDFGTMEKNLKAGVYQNAKDFYNDAQLVFQNCYKFNPDGDAVNQLGHKFEELFESLWREKVDWLATHAPTAAEQSPSELYSDEDEDEEEEEEEMDPSQAQFLAIQQQIAALNETAQALLQQQQQNSGKPATKTSGKKKKSGAPVKRKSLPLSVPPPPKPTKPAKRVRAPAPLTFAQKQEISEGISTLGDAEMRKAVQIIRNGCPHLANVHDDEMELDMDEINDETLRELFKFVKSIRGPKGAVMADDDFEPPRQVTKQGTSRPKKNKPMGKTEQEDNMRKIQEKLQSFHGGASGSSQSPTAHDASSDDEESSGSESEEE